MLILQATLVNQLLFLVLPINEGLQEARLGDSCHRLGVKIRLASEDRVYSMFLPLETASYSSSGFHFHMVGTMPLRCHPDSAFQGALGLLLQFPCWAPARFRCSTSSNFSLANLSGSRRTSILFSRSQALFLKMGAFSKVCDRIQKGPYTRL